MNGLEVLQCYSVKFSELDDRIIAETQGEITPIDSAKLIHKGWIKITGSEYHWLKPKKEEPKNSPVEDTDIYEDYSS